MNIGMSWRAGLRKRTSRMSTGPMVAVIVVGLVVIIAGLFMAR